MSKPAWMEAMQASRKKHGHGREADRAHMQEMLERDDLPPAVRASIQNALSRHDRMDRVEEHGRRKK